MATDVSNVKAWAQRWLTRVGIYDRLKASVVYDAYWLVCNPEIIRQRTREVDFYRSTLIGFRSGDLIFDVGANHGHKTDIFLRLGARVVAVDPDPVNQERLRKKFLTFRWNDTRVRIISKAVSAKVGVTRMWIDAPGSAKNTLSAKWVDTLRADVHRFGERLEFASGREVPTTTLDELIRSNGRPFFIKIDVEGHEPDVLRGLGQRVKFLSFEVNLPEFAAEGVECIQLLAGIARDGEFNFARPSDSKLACEHWLPANEFVQCFARITDPSVEVYWRTA